MEKQFSLAVTGDEIPNELVLVQRLKDALKSGTKKLNIIHGFEVETDSHVRISTGPVIGEVTANSAVIMLELVGPKDLVPITTKLYKKGDKQRHIQALCYNVPMKRPFIFQFNDLEASTEYTVIFNGVCKYHVTNRFATFTTKSIDMVNFRMIALTCDRPSRLLLGQQNPWEHMLNHAILRSKNPVNTILHIGDQIYPDDEDIQDADKIFNEIYDTCTPSKKVLMSLRGRELWRNKYRNVFSTPGKVSVLSRASNLMIWSDNDVANDFTTMKNEDGSQTYHPHFLKCGMRTYREYQRRLWDPKCPLDIDNKDVQEWHSHTYGCIGIFMFDLRGNRITSDGIQMSDRSLISSKQWEDFETFLLNPNLRAVILCSETPFVGDEPRVVKEKVKESFKMNFLMDHWSFNEDELIRLLDLCFSWKLAGEEKGIGKDVLLIGGDIHCGVTSVIRDNETGLLINHITTSPVTNHVCDFFPSLSGNISDRYNFSHLPLGKQFRNYADVRINVEEEEVFIQARLIPISTDIFKNLTWATKLDSKWTTMHRANTVSE